MNKNTVSLIATLAGIAGIIFVVNKINQDRKAIEATKQSRTPTMDPSFIDPAAS